LVALAVDGRFDEPRPSPAAGLLIGAVYRLRVTQIPFRPGLEVFPTIEMINRLYPPRGQERRFSVPIEFTQEDLELALDGKFVTRVVYLEDPQNAAPMGQEEQSQNWFEIKPGQDPLVVADALGRPMAIVRIGGRLPLAGEAPDPEFFYGCPPWIKFAPRPVIAAAPARPVLPPVQTPRKIQPQGT
jgi:hypothetical protein